VRRTQSSEGSLTVPGGAGTLAGVAATSSFGRSAHRSGSGSSAGSGAGAGGGAGPRVYPRQSSIRIGPLPKSALVEDGTLVDGAEAVLEVARQNLSANEVELIERALRKGKPLSVVESDGSKRPGRRTHHHNHSHRSTTPVSPGTPTTVVMGDSRHSTSEASASFTSDELDGAASNHPMDIASEHTIRSGKVSPGEVVTCTAVATSSVNEAYDLRGAEENLSEEELRQIQQALDEDAGPVMAAPVEEHISEADASAIHRAIREAEEEEEMRNFRLALQMQQEEDERLREEARRTRLPQGNVRVMTRAELAAESRVGAFQAVGPPVEHHPLDHQPNTSPGGHVAAGFRMNANAGRHEWTRRDQNSVVGPNQEVRTKHDATLDGQSNAHRLGLDEDETGTMSHVGNTAYNSFLQSVQRRNNRKGVSAHGTGRAGGSDADATRGGAMDANVRLQISRAINNGYIDRCNGVVKEGKEAVVYHADCGEESGGFDVAIKVFKRIQDFKGRGDYVDGDPRFAHENFRRISGREQLELWTEKEFRNLTRAIRAGVPAPTPLFHKDNILFMRFLGTDGWPAPQLREIDVRHGSKKWNALYLQVMDAIRRYVM
jgi:serine/threonine-protein kinase RIO1